MNEAWLDCVPEAARDGARSAVAAAFGTAPVTGLEPVVGGASGALTYRVDVGGRPYLLRMETNRNAPMRNPHQYVCLRTAAEAGIAPPLRHLDDAAGVVVMDFLPARPLSEYPGGPAALARDVGGLAARLHATPAFPELYRFPVVVERLLGLLRTSGMFADGLLDPHAEALASILEAYHWDAASTVSSHNDPNPRNILFDGERLWLIDWETSYRNDPLTDVAILVENLAPTAELETHLVEAWLGGAADGRVRARLTLMRLLTRVYYAGLLSFASRGRELPPENNLSALTPAAFGAAVAQGRLKPASPELMRALAKMCLAGFMEGTQAPGFEDALAIARAG